MSRRGLRRVRGMFRLAYHALLFGVAMTAGIAMLGRDFRTGGWLLAATLSAVVLVRLSRFPARVWFFFRRVTPDDASP